VRCHFINQEIQSDNLYERVLSSFLT